MKIKLLTLQTLFLTFSCSTDDLSELVGDDIKKTTKAKLSSKEKIVETYIIKYLNNDVNKTKIRNFFLNIFKGSGSYIEATLEYDIDPLDSSIELWKFTGTINRKNNNTIRPGGIEDQLDNSQDVKSLDNYNLIIFQVYLLKKSLFQSLNQI